MQSPFRQPGRACHGYVGRWGVPPLIFKERKSIWRFRYLEGFPLYGDEAVYRMRHVRRFALGVFAMKGKRGSTGTSAWNAADALRTAPRRRSR